MMGRLKLTTEQKRLRARERQRRWKASMSPEKMAEFRVKNNAMQKSRMAKLTLAQRRKLRKVPEDYWKTPRRRWKRADDERLREVFSRWPRDEILRLFPGRSWKGIRDHARVLKIYRPRQYKNKSIPSNSLIRCLMEARITAGLTQQQLSKKMGFLYEGMRPHG